jgi:hypothetical protein
MEDFFTNLLESELFVQVLAAIVAAVWVAFKSSQAYQNLKSKKFDTVFEAAEVGVDRVYKTYVKKMKANGTWSEAEKQNAMNAAKEVAIEYAKKEGVDALRYVADAYLEVLIEDIIRKRKAEAVSQALPVPPANGN